MTIQATGALSPKNASNTILSKTRPWWQEIVLLLGLGAAAIFAHAATRNMLDLPGHQGLTLFALIMMGRTTSRTRWAAVTSAVGAATVSLMPFWGFNDPLRWLMLLLAGATVDLGFLLGNRWQQRLWFVALLGGLAHMTKPLTRSLLTALTGLGYNSLLLGTLYPSATHFLFGAAGALIGAGVMLYFQYTSQPRTQQ